jgi:hypothetical protein
MRIKTWLWERCDAAIDAVVGHFLPVAVAIIVCWMSASAGVLLTLAAACLLVGLRGFATSRLDRRAATLSPRTITRLLIPAAMVAGFGATQAHARP